MMPRDDEVAAPARCLRDLGRAVKTFALVADIENEELIKSVPYAGGPFALPKGQEWFSNIVLVPQDGVAEEQVFIALRAGVNAATALLRSAGYRVSLQARPIEQITIPGSGPEKPPEPAPEETANVEPPEGESAEPPAEPPAEPEEAPAAAEAPAGEGNSKVRKKRAS
jgi:hypothetical protein